MPNGYPLCTINPQPFSSQELPWSAGLCFLLGSYLYHFYPGHFGFYAVDQHPVNPEDQNPGDCNQYSLENSAAVYTILSKPDRLLFRGYKKSTKWESFMATAPPTTHSIE